jgi:hypothetical protein
MNHCFCSLKQELANYRPETESSPPPISIKLNWNVVTFINVLDIYLWLLLH